MPGMVVLVPALPKKNVQLQWLQVKFMFSKKATKIDEIFTVNLTVTTYCQIDGEYFVNFVAFSENVNFKIHVFLDDHKYMTKSPNFFWRY